MRMDLGAFLDVPAVGRVLNCAYRPNRDTVIVSDIPATAPASRCIRLRHSVNPPLD